MTATITALELRIVEEALQMESGYVLDFTDRSFGTFFEDFGIDIAEDRYCGDGMSKAKRLRRFLRSSDPQLTGRVLQGLLEHRLVTDPDGLSPERRSTYERIVKRLTGAGESSSPGSEERDDLRAVFDPQLFARLPIDGELRGLLLGRVQEAEDCLRARAYLAVVILCGSVLEGLCMGFGDSDVNRVGVAYTRRYRRPPPERLGDWTLAEWLAVLSDLEVLSPTVEKYGHALRNFRNYVHPAQQLRAGFVAGEPTAKISLQVVLAAVEDLVRASSAKETTNA